MRPPLADAPAARSAPALVAPARGAYPRLLAGVASWFGFWGMQMVVFQWLIVEVLAEAPARVGTAQMAVAAPSLFFLLLGGATADRFEPRRLLLCIHVATAVVVGALAWAIASGALSYELLIAYAVVIGTLQAFGFPARDTQLSQVVSGSMSRAVAGTIISQQLAQTLGALAAGTASWLGGLPVLGLQILVVAGGAIPIAALPLRRPRASVRAPLSLAELRAGLVEVFRSPVLRPVMFLSISAGVLFVGPYLVILPLLVRDVYAGGAAEMGVLMAMFPLGSMIGSVTIVARGGLARNGMALAVGHFGAAFCLGVLALGLPFWGTVLGVLGWGLSGSLFLNASRTLFQQHASEENRARVLSVSMLGVMGGAPIGSLAAGLVATPLGLQGALALDCGVSLAVTLGVLTFTRLATLR